jgi:hypothetical protein
MAIKSFAFLPRSLFVVTAILVSLAACSGGATDAPSPASMQPDAEVTMMVPPPESIGAGRQRLFPPPFPQPSVTRPLPLQAYYLTSTTPGFIEGTFPKFNATASPSTLTLTANGSPGNFTLHARAGDTSYSYSIAELNSGSANCPAGDVAFDQATGTSQIPVTVAAYAAGQCVFSIGVGDSTVQLIVNVLTSVGGAPAGTIAGVFPAPGGGLAVQSWAAANPTETSTLFQTSACAGATGLARSTAGETYIAIGSVDPGPCHLIEAFAVGASGSALPIASVTLPAGSAIGGLAIDRLGNVYVALPGASAVEEYSPDLKIQLAVLSGSNTGLDQPVSIAFDGAGNLYVIDFPLGLNIALPGHIAEFAPLSPGANNVAPIQTILTQGDKECSPANSPSIAIDASTDVFSGNVSGGITEFIAGGGSLSLVGPGSANGLTIDESRLYESLSPVYGCAQAPTETPSLEYFDLSNPASPVPFVTTTSGTSPQLITY